jgi:hypothetical protein
VNGVGHPSSPIPVMSGTYSVPSSMSALDKVWNAVPLSISKVRYSSDDESYQSFTDPETVYTANNKFSI